MANYEAKIIETSTELTAKSKLLLKDFSNAQSLDNVIKEGESIILHPNMYAILSVHNENSAGDKDYTKYVIIDEDGTKYVTGSTSFFDSFKEIYDELSGSGEEYGIQVTKYPSRNYQGKYFIKCSVV